MTDHLTNSVSVARNTILINSAMKGRTLYDSHSIIMATIFWPKVWQCRKCSIHIWKPMVYSVLLSDGGICTAVTGKKQVNCHIFGNSSIVLLYHSEWICNNGHNTDDSYKLLTTVKVVPEVVYDLLMTNGNAVNPTGVNRCKICATSHKTFQQQYRHCD